MRPIERRLAAVEARTTNPAAAGYRLFFLPKDGNEATFRAQCEAEAAGQPCRFIRFVRPGDVMSAMAFH